MEEMVQLEQQFRVGELVWAKFSNYPYWPGYIKKILDNNTFEVYYFGDDEKSIETKDKLKKWRDFFDEAIKGDITDEKFLFSLGVAMMVQEKDPSVRNHKKFINEVTPEKKQEIIQDMKDFLIFSKTGDAKNTLLRRKKRKPSITTEELLKDIKPMKEKIDKSFIELKKILEKYNKSFKEDSNKLFCRNTSVALNSANETLKKYNKKYNEIIQPFKHGIFEKLDIGEPNKLITSLGNYLKNLKKQKLSRKCLKFFEIYNLFTEIFRNVFGVIFENFTVEEFYACLCKNKIIPTNQKRLSNEKIAADNKRNEFRDLLSNFIKNIYFYIQDGFIKVFVGYIETYCWNINNKKMNDSYINLIEKVVDEIMNNNKERNQWNVIKKGKSNGEIETTYTLV